jgi:MerR family transcriptional regulator, copper efflux regulator
VRIGELAFTSEVSTKTVRYYEHIGIVDAPARTPSGYRDYGDDAVERLKFIRSAQRIGLTLNEIRGIIEVRNRGVAPCSHVLALITEHASDIDQRISELLLMKRALNSLVREAAALDPAKCAPSSVCSIITG